jgi:hypothetical protein
MLKKPPNEAAPLGEPEWIFPYASMSIGDSFFIPTMRPAYLTYVIDTTSKKGGIKVKIYTTTEKGVLGCRTWRVA